MLLGTGDTIQYIFRALDGIASLTISLLSLLICTIMDGIAEEDDIEVPPRVETTDDDVAPASGTLVRSWICLKRRNSASP